MKHLTLFLFILVFSNNSSEELTTSHSNKFLEQNSQHETFDEDFTSAPENIEETTNSILNPQFVRVKFYNSTTQQQINESLGVINPMNYLRCENNPNVYIMVINIPPTTGDGRGSGSGSSRDNDNAIESIGSIPYIQNYRIGAMCN